MKLLERIFGPLFDTSGFTPRWSCGDWSTLMGWLHIGSDVAIFGAYMAIPASLAVVIRRRRDLPLRPIFWLFVAFILFCGLTHLVEAVLFYQPVYRFSAMMKVATALVSWATVAALAGALPEAIALPGIRAQNRQLTAEIARRAEAEAALEAARTELELRTSHLTLRERRVTDALSAASVGAVRWEIDSGRVLWEIGVLSALRRMELEAHDMDDWGAVMAPGDALAFRIAATEAASAGKTLYTTVSFQVGRRSQPAMLAGRADPEVAGQARTMTGMVRLIVD
ncbi:MAG: hypothetical protein IBJ10_03225 [Phycisphaerales bacterium]|nr:hypothetical protein [Phycisphaerales bacterium]